MEYGTFFSVQYSVCRVLCTIYGYTEYTEYTPCATALFFYRGGVYSGFPNHTNKSMNQANQLNIDISFSSPLVSDPTMAVMIALTHSSCSRIIPLSTAR